MAFSKNAWAALIVSGMLLISTVTYMIARTRHQVVLETHASESLNKISGLSETTKSTLLRFTEAPTALPTSLPETTHSSSSNALNQAQQSQFSHQNEKDSQQSTQTSNEKQSEQQESLQKTAIKIAANNLTNEANPKTSSNSVSSPDHVKISSILAFGDSLTQGLCPTSIANYHMHPYAENLQKLVGSNVIVHEHGISGELTSAMLHRLPRLIASLPQVPDVVVILGGTNDLGHHKSADDIYLNIVKLHNAAHSFGNESFVVRTIAVTLPEISWPINETERVKLNNKIRNRILNSQKSKTSHELSVTSTVPTIAYNPVLKEYLLDLDRLTSLNDSSHNNYWSHDKVHFSDIGYDYFGEQVFNVLKSNDVL